MYPRIMLHTTSYTTSSPTLAIMFPETAIKILQMLFYVLTTLWTGRERKAYLLDLYYPIDFHNHLHHQPSEEIRHRVQALACHTIRQRSSLSPWSVSTHLYSRPGFPCPRAPHSPSGLVFSQGFPKASLPFLNLPISYAHKLGYSFMLGGGLGSGPKGGASGSWPHLLGDPVGRLCCLAFLLSLR